MPEKDWFVPLSDLRVDGEISAAVREVVELGWWSMGPRVEAFETAFASFTGARHAVALANGTAALHLALLAVGCTAGDEVVLPSLNFVAAANTVIHTGATPVFCDIRGPADLNLDPEDLEAAIGPATKAVVVLHYGGFPCDMDAVLEIAANRGLAVVEDAAHAPGSVLNGRMCGVIGRVGCFSFFSNKNLPIGEGGMIVTDDDEVAERVRLLRSHGMTTLTWDRHRGHAHSYDVVLPGFNYRLDEIRAAVGLIQLERLPSGNVARAEISERYRAAFEQVPDLVVPFANRQDRALLSHHLAVLVAPSEETRERIRAKLRERQIQTSVHYPPIHRFSCYEGQFGDRPLTQTDDVAGRLVTLPLYPHMTDAQVEAVIGGVLDALQRP
jgi:dTDP-4-amino-4,6-dideoxygalactose transaminase